ncbi:Cold-regulated 413 inner membrane protein 1, chloroplastic [Dichanthelium oligosanthes]|uniref:Cold-regulated 413 inner membrane protein 1, chloroplastic n=1 Tax=Dichanthelium oligosanthes TaxID=888268 RepID=A0A1E5VL81_9POAL|nr:Cold-regulated 413 inner membrane protein 1, chloroplastic [Dichanthelium oligosanthes]
MSISMRLAISAPTAAPPRLRVRAAGNGGSLPAARVALRTETDAVRGCASLPLKPQPLGAGAGQPSRRRGAAAVCHSSAHLSARTMQWISAGASAVLLLAKGTAIRKSFLVPFFALQAPCSIISWINFLYLHLTIIGELELPLSTILLVSVAPYQLMNLRGTQGGAVLSLAIAGYLAFQHFTRVGGLGKAFEQGSIIATLAIICITVVPLMLLF